MKVEKLPLKKKIAWALFRKQRDNEMQLHELRQLFWECTLRCNLNCRHCGSDCTKNSRVNDMPASDFYRVLDEVKAMAPNKLPMVILTGGEALMRRDLAEIGATCNSKGFAWGLVSNGMLLDKVRLEQLLDGGLGAITISLDGSEEAHTWLRMHPKSYSKAIEAISLLTQYPQLAFDVVTCANGHNIDELPTMKEMLISLGVKRWRLFTIFPVGRAANDPHLQLEAKKFKQLFDFIREERKDERIHISYGCEGYLGNYEYEVRDHFFFCRAGINVASVLVDGSISACPNLRENFVQGTIYKDNFADAWLKRYQKYRDRSWTQTGECAQCNDYNKCLGNGLHLRNEKTGELLFCHLKRLKEAEKIK